MKILVDINVVMDVLTARAPFYAAAVEVWKIVERRQAVACVASISCTTIYYLARRINGRERALDGIQKVLDLFEIVPVDRKMLEQALTSGMIDYEDAVQAYAGLSAGATHVVSRDAGGFRGGPLQILTPDQFIAAFGPS